MHRIGKVGSSFFSAVGARFIVPAQMLGSTSPIRRSFRCAPFAFRISCQEDQLSRSPRPDAKHREGGQQFFFGGGIFALILRSPERDGLSPLTFPDKFVPVPTYPVSALIRT
jgi:hypothetical protein